MPGEEETYQLGGWNPGSSLWTGGTPGDGSCHLKLLLGGDAVRSSKSLAPDGRPWAEVPFRSVFSKGWLLLDPEFKHVFVVLFRAWKNLYVSP